MDNPKPAGPLATRTMPGERRLLAILLLIVVALASRCLQFGNPVIQVDDQFYRLVADRMWRDGAIPYVTIWDRKPIGLFLLYEAIRALGGPGVLGYQLAAMAAATVTAWLITRLARPIAGPAGATMAGVVYLLYLPVFGGDGGQDPVFYNGLMAGAVLAVRTALGGPLVLMGCLAMALTGVALQLKESVLFEGVFFGVAMLVVGRHQGRSVAQLILASVLWIAIALVPTVIAWGWYAVAGYGDAFFFANFQSILDRGSATPGETLGRLGGILWKTAPLDIAAIMGAGEAYRAGAPDADRRLMVGWVLASIAGVLIFGSYFDHYALPMLAPLAVVAAPVLARRDRGVALVTGARQWLLPAGAAVALFAATLGLATVLYNRDLRGVGGSQRAMAAAIRPRLHGRCLFVFDGESVLYLMTDSCLPTRWPFPDHLNNARETGAIGTDQLGEVRRIMAGRPPVVVASLFPDRKMNPIVAGWMRDALARDYTVIGMWPVGDRVRVVYERRGSPRAGAAAPTPSSR